MQASDILSVSELTLSIKKHLEGRFQALKVQGEITNFKEQASGHLYFTLKDAQAQISAVLFRGNAASLKRLPKNGDQVIVQGEINLISTSRCRYRQTDCCQPDRTHRKLRCK